MMSELFDTTESLAPRTRWLHTHGLIVRDYISDRGGWQHSGLNTDRYLVANRAMTRYASGDSEESAEAAFATRYDIDWWKLAGWNGAMG